jgi:hypothetical protein
MTAFDSWYTGTAIGSGCSPATGTPGATATRGSSFVIDGEAVVLGVDGVADFNALYFRKHDDEVDPISDFVTVVPWLDQIARSSSSTPHHFLFR